ncbi:FAD-dependent monooxygenase [Mycobacteroides chelonae]|jgi:5-methylphenazine-1-carboxylate 1-monooxygenase|uniref:Flavin-dependent oxidoreductase n=1 Tax=Mycobacteroides chelonae TaxID=1774 RepID=A0A1S1M2P0_MYCCH|nr:FAD-dependent monooxygenase [Mycobacteroides chelonae]OHU23047.1 flavin-dependent oxidoreductase [Mycobacteroides chelonae]OHU29183.1 flavin-dependent oxidoreductase [Mycobacteroides chelonae]OHU77148.1 flavin-dependent oxidoreductase [Mycobacteroides chelonae]QQG87711.1 flavin-dependent oxidoreductase [Mycobacteroides chelonae]QQG92529.1 flavin-dependent oxidoreductase [Mycobacteroides chelonae]
MLEYMSTNETSVVIAGAGIGGLTSALALHTKGFDVKVLEGAREVKPLGVGINMLPHAVGALTELGLGAQLMGMGIATTEIRFCDKRGTILYTEPRGLAGDYLHPQISVHRGQLQLMLLNAVRERIGPQAVQTGNRVLGFDSDGDRVRVRTTGRDITGTVLIGADGVNSVIRTQLHPVNPLRWSGVRMWRGASDVGPFLTGKAMIAAHDDTNHELIAYPISDRTVNWVALARTDPSGELPAGARWNDPVTPDEVLDHFPGWDFGWLNLDRMVRATERIVEYPMVDRDPLTHWGQGHVTLLGDAAHPMYPLGANGGSQAVVDARSLAQALSEFRDDPARGLAEYESQRITATRDVVLANRAMLKSWGEESAEGLQKLAQSYRQRTRA